MLSSLARDFQFAARALARRPAFTLVALLTLALGVGANTAVFSVVNGIVLNRLPYREPDRLVAFGDHFISNAELLYLQENIRSFESVASYSPGWDMALTSGGDPARVVAAKVSTNFLGMLGVGPVQGRDFTADESTPGRDRVVLLEYGIWQRRFGGDRNVVGTSVTLDGNPHTVVGVLPRGFHFYSDTPADFLMPIAIDPTSRFHRGQNALAFARLVPGATVPGALAELRAQIPAIREAFGFAADYGRALNVVLLQDYLIGPVRTMLLVVMGAVGFIVLIAAANVGNLLLVRASERRREIGVRVALGASRWRVVRGLMAESVTLASGGSILGLALATGGVGVLRRLLPADTPRLAEVAVDGRVLALCAVVGMITALAGVLPSLLITRGDPQSALRQGRGSDPAGHLGQRLRGAFVAVEIALALVLVIGAGLMLRTLGRLAEVDPGFQAEGAMVFRLQPTGGRLTTAAETRQYFERVLERVRALPGVAAAGGIHHLPMSGYSWQTDITIDGRPLATGAAPPRAGMRIISGDYFRAMGIPLVTGRGFEPRDAAGAERVVLVNEMLARRLFPNEDPVGRRIAGGNVPRGEFARIIGVVGNVRHESLDLTPPAELYLPLAQFNMPFQSIVVRSSSDPRALFEPVRRAVRELDATVPIADVRTLDEVVRGSMARRRLVLQLLTVFALIGLTLGAIGVYGVVAYAVTQRTREIGVRMALGATRTSVVGLVIRHGTSYAVAGLAAGMLGALGVTRVLSGLVYDVSTTDPVVYLGVALLVLGVSILASWVPARRAARVDPMVAMRED